MDKVQPWLNSKWTDIIFILSPAFLSLFLVILFPAQFQNSSKIPVYYWLFLIVFIDVAHVYSTLYRTYFNPGNFKKQNTLLISIPIGCYIMGVILYNFEALWFWRVLAYLAVYHFVRQQYGFMRLYSRKEKSNSLFQAADKLSIYFATLYPLMFWHLKAERNFNWFVEGDFFSFEDEGVLKYASILYILVIAIYIFKEIITVIKDKWINIPKNLLIVGTFLSWYFGIVYFNGDMAFTTLNVISHGIPYMALIWFFENKKRKKNKLKSNFLDICFNGYGLVLFVVILILFAYLQEGLWDGLIWKEHQTIFNVFSSLPQVKSRELLSLLIPLLALPQATHYVLDGFIWKAKNDF